MLRDFSGYEMWIGDVRNVEMVLKASVARDKGSVVR
jgi:hypothetical protein